MMQGAVKLFKGEMERAAVFLKFMVKELWVAAAVAGVLQLARGSGGMLEFVKGMLMVKAVVLPLQVWKWLQQDFQPTLEALLEKSCYMERRLMKAEMHGGDICRQVSQDVCSYEESCGNQLWLQRRLRDHYEAWMKANGGIADLKKKLVCLWSMVCTEVLLRNCRDIVAKRWSFMEAGETMPQEKFSKHLKILRNLAIDFSSFWSPMDEEAWGHLEALEPEHYMETCLKSQLLERKLELVEYFQKAGDYVSIERMLVGMPELVKSFWQASQSSGDGGEVKKEM